MVEEEGSFSITRLEATTIQWTAAYDNYDDDAIIFTKDGGGDGYSVSNCMRAVAEPLLISHFGEAIIDDVFNKYTEILTDCIIAEENTQFINVTVSMKRML